MSTDNPTIRSLTARAVNAPLARPVRTAVGTIPAAPLVLLDILTAEGVTGRAYVFGYTPMTLAPLARFVDNIADTLKGKSASPVERMREFDRMFRLLGRQGLVGMALSGIEMALWDVLGRACGQPVVRLLGGEPSPIPAYDSYGVVDPKADRRALESSLERGFRAIKIKIGDGGIDNDVNTVAAVRGIVGDEALSPGGVTQHRDAIRGFLLVLAAERAPEVGVDAKGFKEAFGDVHRTQLFRAIDAAHHQPGKGERRVAADCVK